MQQIIKKKKRSKTVIYYLVHLAGIEPVRVASLDPKSSASASSAIGAVFRLVYFIKNFFYLQHAK